MIWSLSGGSSWVVTERKREKKSDEFNKRRDIKSVSMKKILK